MKQRKQKFVHYSKLRLSASAYFYRYCKGAHKDFRKRIETLFDKIKSGREIVDDGIHIEAVNKTPKGKGCPKCRVSALCFPYKSKVPFIADAPKEIKYAYLCIVDFDGYLVISKKNIVLPASFMDELSPIPAKTLSEFLLTNESLFESIATTNMARSDSAIRGKSYTARDLAVSLPNIGNNSYALNRMRIFNAKKKERSSLHLTTSRVSQSNHSKEEFKDYLIWAARMCDAIKKAGAKKKKQRPTSALFLGNFAEPSSYEEEYEQLEPIACLFLPDAVNTIRERLEGEEDGDALKLANKLKGASLDTIKINSSTGKGKWLSYKMQLELTKQGIKLISEELDKIKFAWDPHNPDAKISVRSYLNRNKAFVVFFKDICKNYFNNTLYEDKNLLGNIERVKELIRGDVAPSYCGSEKGTNKSGKKFAKSLFAWAENTQKREYDYLICDDGSGEWADYIGISKQKVSLYHMKAKGGSSAKTRIMDTYDVLGQALKNLCWLRPGDVALEKLAVPRWEGLVGAGRNIRRMRAKGSAQNAYKTWKAAKSDVETKYAVHVVTSAFSCKEVKGMIDKAMVSPESESRGLRLVWLLSGLYTACLEQNAELVIHCKE